MKRKEKIRLAFPAVLLLVIWAIQIIPGWGEFYARKVYPVISYPLSLVSSLFPFSIGDLFIFCCIVYLIAYPIYAIYKKRGWKKIVLHIIEFLAWIYIWFYAAWGLNYSQDSFYERTDIAYSAYTPEKFQFFLDQYIPNLNKSYVVVDSINSKQLRDEVVKGYLHLSDSLGINAPQVSKPRVKRMLFSPISSMVGVTGSMAPFFNEFTVNKDVRPTQYPATYAHELSHLLGITSEAEANFYAYEVCTQSDIPEIRFSGYFSILSHVLGNAYRLLPEDKYIALRESIRPEIIELIQSDQAYWSNKYSPVIGEVQNWLYDLYLKGNNIESGRKNYSEVIGLLISYQNRNNQN